MMSPMYRHRTLAVALAGAVLNLSPVAAQETVRQTVAFDGSAPAFQAFEQFDPRLGELLRVQLEISGTARGEAARYGVAKKRFEYRGAFAVTQTPNFGDPATLASLRVKGEDGAPPSPDSLSAVDWTVAVFGTRTVSTGLDAFIGNGLLYFLYRSEGSLLHVRDADRLLAVENIDDSTLRARATVTYIYRPTPVREVE